MIFFLLFDEPLICFTISLDRISLFDLLKIDTSSPKYLHRTSNSIMKNMPNKIYLLFYQFVSHAPNTDTGIYIANETFGFYDICKLGLRSSRVDSTCDVQARA